MHISILTRFYANGDSNKHQKCVWQLKKHRRLRGHHFQLPTLDIYFNFIYIFSLRHMYDEPRWWRIKINFNRDLRRSYAKFYDPIWRKRTLDATMRNNYSQSSINKKIIAIFLWFHYGDVPDHHEVFLMYLLSIRNVTV